jgi:hypothetical protein
MITFNLAKANEICNNVMVSSVDYENDKATCLMRLVDHFEYIHTNVGSDADNLNNFIADDLPTILNS